MLEKRLKLWEQLGIEALQKEITKIEKQVKKLEDQLWEKSERAFLTNAKFRSSYLKFESKVDIQRKILLELKEVYNILTGK